MGGSMVVRTCRSAGWEHRVMASTNWLITDEAMASGQNWLGSVKKGEFMGILWKRDLRWFKDGLLFTTQMFYGYGIYVMNQMPEWIKQLSIYSKLSFCKVRNQFSSSFLNASTYPQSMVKLQPQTAFHTTLILLQGGSEVCTKNQHND